MNQMSPPHTPAPHPGAATAAGRTITAPLGFTVPQDEKPVFHSSALTGGAPKIFFQVEEIPVEIADMRPIAGSLDLDRQGSPCSGTGPLSTTCMTTSLSPRPTTRRSSPS
jgi:hypothetical protein